MRTLMFIVTLSITARVWKQLVSINRRMDKEDVVYIYIMKYYSAIKKMKFCHLQQHKWTWRALRKVK